MTPKFTIDTGIGQRVRSHRGVVLAALLLGSGSMFGTAAVGWPTQSPVILPLAHIALGLGWLATTERQARHDRRWVRDVLRDVMRQQPSQRIRIRTDGFEVLVESSGAIGGEDERVR